MKSYKELNNFHRTIR